MLPSKSEQSVSSLQLERVIGNFAVVVVSLLSVRPPQRFQNWGRRQLQVLWLYCCMFKQQGFKWGDEQHGV